MSRDDTERATIRDVAEAAGVSTATVSRVLNGTARVSEATRQRVQRAVDALEFVTSPGARTLRPGVRSMTWGLLVDEFDSHWFGRLADELDRAARQHESTLIISATQKRHDRERHLIQEMAARRVDGLFIVPTTSTSRPGHRWPAPMPVVHIDRIPSGQLVDVVTFDYYGAVATQIEQLWSRGHRRIAFIGGVVAEDPGSRRYAAYRDKVREHGQQIDDDLISTGHLEGDTAATALQSMQQLPEPPTAIVTTIGSLLLALLRVAPPDLEIVGSEDFGAGFLAPSPLTLVQADAGELARQAADVLTARIEGTLGDEPVTKLLPTTLIEYRRRSEENS